jgi:hypothetical protein
VPVLVSLVASPAGPTSAALKHKGEAAMEIESDLQRLVRRHQEIRQAMRRPGGVRILEERELHAIGERLKRLPAAMPMLQPDALAVSSMR